MIEMISDLYSNLDKYPVQPTIQFGDLKNKFSIEPP